jgi:hypothetical protein
MPVSPEVRNRTSEVSMKSNHISEGFFHFAEVPDATGSRRQRSEIRGQLSSLSDYIGESALHSTKIPHAADEEEKSDAETRNQTRKGKRRPPGRDGPAETVDHADHRVERIKHSPFFGHDG